MDVFSFTGRDIIIQVQQEQNIHKWSADNFVQFLHLLSKDLSTSALHLYVSRISEDHLILNPELYVE